MLRKTRQKLCKLCVPPLFYPQDNPLVSTVCYWKQPLTTSKTAVRYVKTKLL